MFGTGLRDDYRGLGVELAWRGDSAAHSWTTVPYPGAGGSWLSSLHVATILRSTESRSSTTSQYLGVYDNRPLLILFLVVEMLHVEAAVGCRARGQISRVLRSGPFKLADCYCYYSWFCNARSLPTVLACSLVERQLELLTTRRAILAWSRQVTANLASPNEVAI